METPNAERDVVQSVGIYKKMLDQARQMMQHDAQNSVDAQISPLNEHGTRPSRSASVRKAVRFE